jgi:hypothetical protein
MADYFLGTRDWYAEQVAVWTVRVPHAKCMHAEIVVISDVLVTVTIRSWKR